MPKSYPVVYQPKSFDELTELVGDRLSDVEVAIQMVLQRTPRIGTPFKNNLRAILITPPGKRIKVVYEFDGEAVFIVKIFGSEQQLSDQVASATS